MNMNRVMGTNLWNESVVDGKPCIVKTGAGRSMPCAYWLVGTAGALGVVPVVDPVPEVVLAGAELPAVPPVSLGAGAGASGVGVAGATIGAGA